MKKAIMTIELEYLCSDTSKPVGYHLMVHDATTGEILDDYRAGNAPWESTQRIDPSDPNALSKETIIQYAESTARDTIHEFAEQDIKVVWDEEVEDSKENCY